MIEAGQSYDIYEEIKSNGSEKYTYARLHKTIVEDEEIILLYSADGETFGNKQNEITAIIVGAGLIVIGAIMIVLRIRKKGEWQMDKKQLSAEEKAKILKRIKHTMECEKMPLNENDEKQIKELLDGKKTAEQLIAEEENRMRAEGLIK